MNGLRLAYPCSVALALGTMLTSAAYAQPPREATVLAPADEEVRTERVSIRDLDLRSRAGQNILYRQVGLAVKRVCDFQGMGLRDQLTCKDTTLSNTQPQIRNAIERAQTQQIASMTVSILVTSTR